MSVLPFLGFLTLYPLRPYYDTLSTLTVCKRGLLGKKLKMVKKLKIAKETERKVMIDDIGNRRECQSSA